jgi:NAD(P)-dependent dehydrogenase (short-subunit alcohol dehydrogenase family)
MARVTVDFSETTVFVAGGTSGINLGIAEAFATAGARVAVMSRSKEKVDAAVTRLQTLGAQATGGAADVRDPEATSAVLQLAHAAFGDIDVLVSGAAGKFPAAALITCCGPRTRCCASPARSSSTCRHHRRSYPWHCSHTCVPPKPVST